jgi:plasmid replication initiation protein
MGIPQNQYLIFRDFKRRVLDKAIAEVNTHSSICISPQFKKVQRQVVAIRFDIQQNLKRACDADDIQLAVDTRGMQPRVSTQEENHDASFEKTPPFVVR